MLSNSQGQNLIFLISQPRAGSTMTQKILGGHPEICTISEPWLMLHPFYALRTKGYNAEYNAQLSRSALVSFLKMLPQGKDDYLKGISETYNNLYQQALAHTGKSYFLDKTPRYYHIISELYQAFPAASFIILLRNPLAVLCSILSTWVLPQNNDEFSLFPSYKNFYEYKLDLLKAPQLLVKGMNLLGENCMVVNYEKLLQSPEQEISQLCQRLGIEFLPNMLELGSKSGDGWRFGDPKNPYKSSKPNAQNLDKWKEQLKDPQVWRLASDYLEFLASETLEEMGYSYEQLRQCLDEYHPSNPFRLWNTLSLEWLLKERTELASFDYGYYILRIVIELQNRGLWGILMRLLNRRR